MVLVSTYCQSGISTSVSESTQAVRLQVISKTATAQYKPVMILVGSNNTLAHYEQSRGYDQISHALSMACTVQL